MDGPVGGVEPAPDVMARCHASYVEAVWQYIRTNPRAVRKNFDGHGTVTLIRSGMPVPDANVLFVEKAAGPAEPWLKGARALFGPKIPWSVIGMDGGPEDLDRLVPAYGLRPAANNPGMVLDMIPPIPASPSGLRVRTVSTASEYRAFRDIWCRVFRAPRWVFPLVLPEIPRDDPEYSAQTRLFVGYAAQQPVACSSVVVTHRVANIVSVGTVPSARGQGFGAALTWKAVEEGVSLGADVAYLAATQMGYGVYEKMGFRRCAEYPAWRSPVGIRQILSLIGLWPAARRARRTHSLPA